MPFKTEFVIQVSFDFLSDYYEIISKIICLLERTKQEGKSYGCWKNKFDWNLEKNKVENIVIPICIFCLIDFA